MQRFIVIALLAAPAWFSASSVEAWDEPGHVLITTLAHRALPERMPAWLRTEETRLRLGYLSAEPDRWRGQNASVLDHVNAPDHYLDADELADFGLALGHLPRFRNEFVEKLTQARLRQPGRFRPRNANRDKDYTSTVPGLLPYAIEELRWKITSSWTTLLTYEAYADVVRPEEMAAARDNVVHYMGLLSHFVGDASQPLHLTLHHNGWVGDNPNGYTTSREFHQFIDGGVIFQHGIRLDTIGGDVTPESFAADTWNDVQRMLAESASQVEPLYRLEKSGALTQAEGRRFIESRLRLGAANLAGLWIAAFDSTATDQYLHRKLTGRRPPPASQPGATATTAPAPPTNRLATPAASRIGVTTPPWAGEK